MSDFVFCEWWCVFLAFAYGNESIIFLTSQYEKASGVLPFVCGEFFGGECGVLLKPESIEYGGGVPIVMLQVFM